MDVNFQNKTSKLSLSIFTILSIIYIPVYYMQPMPSEVKTQGVLIQPSILRGVFQLDKKQISHNKKTNRCSDQCQQQWLGDGWCDTACANDDCNGDNADCLGWCAPDCKMSWIGDHRCDIDCFRQECQFDGGDCFKLYSNRYMFFNTQGRFHNFSQCQCDPALLHNSKCDEECRTPECNYDDGDCRHQCNSHCPNLWLGDGECDDMCNTAECYYDKGDCKSCKIGCEPGMIGNGVCDKGCNNKECHYDMGDCNGVCWTAEKIDYSHEPFFFPHCRDEWKADGFCDCFCLTEQCDYDFGDCNNVNCTVEHQLLNDLYQRLNLSLTDFNPEQHILKFKT